jgi:hypothetical protein
MQEDRQAGLEGCHAPLHMTATRVLFKLLTPSLYFKAILEFGLFVWENISCGWF